MFRNEQLYKLIPSFHIPTKIYCFKIKKKKVFVVCVFYFLAIFPLCYFFAHCVPQVSKCAGRQASTQAHKCKMKKRGLKRYALRTFWAY